MRALQTGHGQRGSARASRIHLHSSTVGPQSVAGCIEPRPSVSRHYRRFFGGPAPFLQGIPDSLFLSGTLVISIPPNHSLDDITGSGSLTSPSPAPSKTTSDSRKEKVFALATLYLMILRLHERCSAAQTARVSTALASSPLSRFSRVSTPRSRSPLQFLQTRGSSKEEPREAATVALSFVSILPSRARVHRRRAQLRSLLSPLLRGSWMPTLANGRRRRLWRAWGQSLVLGTIASRRLDGTKGEGIKGCIDAHSASRRTRQSHHNLRIHQPRTSTTIASPGPPPATFSSRCHKATRKLSLPSSELLKELRK
ncbi:hypothetical protein BKA70DRAFT_785153 [Coprinopsis sp. MPI-PUGE-AT-0042]|nr:hypothetical protein BKA70DRAFT_785153 [Coprinopsis sp. MPI-PUGE-AT-0042]